MAKKVSKKKVRKKIVKRTELKETLGKKKFKRRMTAIKKRKADKIEQKLCEEFKGSFDVEQEYTSEEMINILREREDFTFEALAGWIFRFADWRHVDEEKTHDIILMLNDMVVTYGTNQGETGLEITQLNDDSFYEFMDHFHSANENQKEMLLDILCEIAANT